MGSATALSFGLGSALGIVAGARPGSLRDRLLSIGSLALYAVPGFWLGLVLTVVFAVQLRWLPLAGIEIDRLGQDRACPRRSTSPAISCCRWQRSASSTWRSICAPCGPAWPRSGAWISCSPPRRAAFRAGASCSRMSRATRCCRWSPCSACNRPPCSAAASSSRRVFSIPGLGRLAQEAVASRDTPLLLGIILVSAVLVISVNLVVDLRLRLARPAHRQRGSRHELCRPLPAHRRKALPARSSCSPLPHLALAAPALFPHDPLVDRRPGAAAAVPGLGAAAWHRPARPRRAGRHRARRAHLAGGRRWRRRRPRSPSARSSARWPASSAALADEALMRITDAFQTVPGFLLALAFVSVVGPSLGVVVIAIALSALDRPGPHRARRSAVDPRARLCRQRPRHRHAPAGDRVPRGPAQCAAAGAGASRRSSSPSRS